MPITKTSAQRAYEAFVSFMGGTCPKGEALIGWRVLDEKVKQAWAVALDASGPDEDGFMCSPLDDEDIPLAVGFIEHPTHIVSIVSPYTDEGIAVTREGATVLAKALLEAVESPHLPPHARPS